MRLPLLAAALMLALPDLGVSLATATPERRSSDDATEVAFLVGVGNADSLATASLLAHLVETKRDTDKKIDSTMLIRHAVALSPDRPELQWLLLRDCELSQCAEEKDIAAQLRALDPGNGLALLPALNAAQTVSPEETTRVMAEIGASPYLRLYWNKLVVMMFDALTRGPKARAATALTYGADDRLSYVTGVLAAVDIPPFKVIPALCSTAQFAQSGRRDACERLMQRLDAADSFIGQSLSVSVQLKWWSPNSQESKALRQKYLQQHYLVEASGRARGARVNEDAMRRVDAMRRFGTEEDVAKAMLLSFAEPVERPDEWQGVR